MGGETKLVEAWRTRSPPPAVPGPQLGEATKTAYSAEDDTLYRHAELLPKGEASLANGRSRIRRCSPFLDPGPYLQPVTLWSNDITRDHNAGAGSASLPAVLSRSSGAIEMKK